MIILITLAALSLWVVGGGAIAAVVLTIALRIDQHRQADLDAELDSLLKFSVD